MTKVRMSLCDRCPATNTIALVVHMKLVLVTCLKLSDKTSCDLNKLEVKYAIDVSNANIQ